MKPKAANNLDPLPDTQIVKQEAISILNRNNSEKFLRAAVTYLLALERVLKSK